MEEVIKIFWQTANLAYGIAIISFLYVVVALILGALWRLVSSFAAGKRDYTSLKTVTFGDESAVRANRVA